MAEIIDEVVSKKALEQVELLKKELNDTLKAFSKNTEAIKLLNKALAKADSQKVNDSYKERNKLLNEHEKIIKSAVVTGHKLNSVHTDENKKLNERKVALSEANRAQKEAIKLENAERNSIKRAELLIKKYTKAKNELNTATEEGARQSKNYAKAIANADKFIKKHGDSVTNQRRSIGNYSLAISGLKDRFLSLKSSILSVLGVGALVGGLVKIAKEGIADARVLEGVRVAFDRLNDPNLLKNLQDATRNTVSNLDLMKAGVQAKNLGVPVEQLGNLFGFAQQRALETGESVDYLVDSIVKGIGRKSPLILDNLGISAIALTEKLGGVKTASASVGQVAEAVGKIIQEEQASSGQAIDATQSLILKSKAQWENLRTELGVRLLPIIADLIEKVVSLGVEIAKIPEKFKEFEKSSEAVKKLSKSVGDLAQAFKPLADSLGAVLGKMAEAVGWFYSKIWIPFATNVLNQWASKLSFLSKATKSFGSIFKAHVTEMEKESVKYSKIFKDLFTGDIDAFKSDLSSKLKEIFNYFKSLKNSAIDGWNSAGELDKEGAIGIDYFKGKFASVTSQRGGGSSKRTPGPTEDEIKAREKAEKKRLADEKKEAERLRKAREAISKIRLIDDYSPETMQKDAEALGNRYRDVIEEFITKHMPNVSAEYQKFINDELLGEKPLDDKTAKKMASALYKSIANFPKHKKDEIAKDVKKTLEEISRIKDYADEVVSGVGDFGGMAFDKAQERLGAEMTALRDKYALEEELIKASYDTQEEKERKVALLNIKRLAEEKRINDESLKLKQRQARFEKAVNIASIISNTALAIMKYQADPGFPAGIPLAIQAGVTGAVQIAKILATPIPQYAKGTSNHTGGLAIVGERGAEVIETPSGGRYLTPSTDTLVNMDAGSKVIPNHELNSYLYQSPKIPRYSTSATNNPIVDNTAKLEELIEITKRKNTSISFYGDAGYNIYQKNNIR